jgi:Glycosyltransferase family 87
MGIAGKRRTAGAAIAASRAAPGARMKSKRLFWPAGAVYVAASAGLLALWPFRSFQSIETFNFFDPLVAARVLRDGSNCIYCAATQQAAATSWVHASASSSFVDPPAAAFILQPIAGLEVHSAVITMLVISLLCLLGAGWLLYSSVLPADLARAKRAIIVGVSFFTVASNALWAGQWAPILLLPAVAAVVCLKGGKHFYAGLLLSILLLKPNLVWLLPVVLLGARQWRLFAGMAAGGVVWIVSTVMILGPQHLSDWPSALGSAFGAVDYSEGIPGLVASLTASTAAAASTAVALGVIAAVTAALWGGRLRRRADLTIGIGITASLLSTPHVYDYDLILLALPLCLWAASNVAAAMTAAAGLRLVFVVTFVVGAVSPGYLTWIVLAATLAGLVVAASGTEPGIPRTLSRPQGAITGGQAS